MFPYDYSDRTVCPIGRPTETVVTFWATASNGRCVQEEKTIPGDHVGMTAALVAWPELAPPPEWRPYSAWDRLMAQVEGQPYSQGPEWSLAQAAVAWANRRLAE